MMNFLDLFSGIGGFRLAFERAGHTCVGFCEIDKFARASYKAMYDTTNELEYHDITKLTEEEWSKLNGKIDIITGGFPCQSFSIAGKRRGFEDTRGTMFFEIVRAAKQIQPQYLVLENVKGLLNHDKGRTFGTILSTLDELGYDAEWQLLNSKDYVAQNRERIFIIGHLRGGSRQKVFPIRRESDEYNQEYKIDVFGSTKGEYQTSLGQRDIVYNSEGTIGSLTATDYKQPKQVAIPVLTPDRANKRQNGRRFKDDGEPMYTLTGQDRHEIMVKEATKKGYSEASAGDSINISRPNPKTRRGRVGKGMANTLLTGEEQTVVLENYRIRKLTPLECWRLQTFPDDLFYKAQAVNSNSQLYKQAGNSATVDVVYEIAKRL